MRRKLSARKLFKETCATRFLREEVPTKPDPHSFLSSWSDEISSRADRVRNLIGDAHWLSDGHHKEAIIRDFLRRYLPPKFRVSRGFIKSASSDKCSREIDVLVSDLEAQSAYYDENDLQIVSPSASISHIEIKTAFTQRNLSDTLENIALARHLARNTLQFQVAWRGAYFFKPVFGDELEKSREVLERSISQIIRDSETFEAIKADAKSIALLLPNCIAVASSFVVFVEPDQDNKRIKLKLFRAGKLAFAYMFGDILSALRQYSNGVGSAEIDTLLESVADFQSELAHIEL